MSIQDKKVLTKRRGATVKRPKQRKTTKKQPSSALGAWLFSGVLIGSLVSGGVFFMLSNKQQSGTAVVTAQNQTTPHEQTPKRQEITLPEPSKPRFDFYTVLPKAQSQRQTHSAQTKETTVAKPKANNQVTSTSQTGSHYLIQAGSFKKLKDADELRARLTLLGFEPDINKVQLKNRELWYRVTVGPFQTADTAYAEQHKLEENHMLGTLVLKQYS